MDAASNILVTGGAGFVGSWLVQLLLERTPARLIVLDNLANGRREFLPASSRVALDKTSLTQRDAIHRLIAERRPKRIFHLAALHFIPYCNAHPSETLEVNVVGTQNLLDACMAHPPACLVIASTAAVYPIQDRPCAEGNRTDPIDVYGFSKWANEKQLEMFARSAPTRCCAARLFNVFGPRETNPHVIPEILKQLEEGREEIEVGNLASRRDYVYAADVAAGLLALAEKASSSFRTYNIGTGFEHSVADILDQFGRIVGRQLRPRIAANRVRRVDREHLVADISRIRSEIGWQPRYDLASGLAELWRSPRALGGSL